MEYKNIITKASKKVYFGAAGYSEFTYIKMKTEQNNIIERHKKDRDVLSKLAMA